MPSPSRPATVTVISILYIGIGVIGAAAHLAQLRSQPFAQDVVWAVLVSLLAAIAGAFMFRARNWARWLALAWIGFHVGLSFFHSAREVIVHALLFAVFAWFLFRPGANHYFRSRRAAAA